MPYIQGVYLVKAGNMSIYVLASSIEHALEIGRKHRDIFCDLDPVRPLPSPIHSVEKVGQTVVEDC